MRAVLRLSVLVSLEKRLMIFTIWQLFCYHHRPTVKLSYSIFKCASQTSLLPLKQYCVLNVGLTSSERKKGDNSDLFWYEVMQLNAMLDNRRLGKQRRMPHIRNHYEMTSKKLLAGTLRSLTREKASSSSKLSVCLFIQLQTSHSSLKMEAAGSSEKLVTIYGTVLRHILEYSKDFYKLYFESSMY
jgi:hypothetical protein